MIIINNGLNRTNRCSLLAQRRNCVAFEERPISSQPCRLRSFHRATDKLSIRLVERDNTSLRKSTAVSERPTHYVLLDKMPYGRVDWLTNATSDKRDEDRWIQCHFTALQRIAVATPVTPQTRADRISDSALNERDRGIDHKSHASPKRSRVNTFSLTSSSS